MSHRPTRARFVAAATAGTFASIGIVARPVQAAQFEYKLAHGATTDFPFHVRTVEAVNAIKRDTGGRLNISLFPNSVMGSELANIGQIRSNTIQFAWIPSIALSTAVPGLAIDGLAFAFRNAHDVESAYDGPMGQYLTKLIDAKGMHGFPGVTNLGMRVVTTSNHPIRTAADFAGMKFRVQPGPIGVDAFRSLGASPTPIVFPELYTALQTHLVDGQETPVQTIDNAKFYEVQKYLSVTNHQATIFWLVGSQDGWNALPHDVQDIVTKHFTEAAVRSRRDTVVQSTAHAEKLRRFGLTFNDADTGSMRSMLKPFYAKWKKEFGDEVWALMEKTTGPLA